jgi:hypothetical protein
MALSDISFSMTTKVLRLGCMASMHAKNQILSVVIYQHGWARMLATPSVNGVQEPPTISLLLSCTLDVAFFFVARLNPILSAKNNERLFECWRRPN